MPRKISLDPNVLDILMPMHLLVASNGTIAHTGPTIAKVHPGEELVGKPILEQFDLRRPTDRTALREAIRHGGARLSLRMRDPARTPLIGIAIPLATGDGVLLNLSFGIAVVDAVVRFGLAGSDFAATDLTLELLYLVEANAAAMEEARKTGERLAGAWTAAEAEAMSDTLTGLKNRRALDQRLRRMIERRTPFTLMHLDLDYFKAVNDTLGHAAGDLVLQGVARILGEETRDVDIVARVGGDEFVIVFSGLTDQERLATIADRLIARMEEPIPYGDHEARISASIGIAPSNLYAMPDIAQMIHDADVALYESKRRGRAQFTFFNPDCQAGVQPA